MIANKMQNEITINFNEGKTYNKKNKAMITLPTNQIANKTLNEIVINFKF